MNLLPGKIVEFQGKDPALQLGVILAITAKGVRLLQLNRKETTVTERSILHQTGQARAPHGDLDACWEAARRIDEKRARLAAGIDLAELHALLSEDSRPYSLREMAGFLSDATDEDAEAALLRRLTTDSLYFRQRKEGYLPIPPAEVQAALEREQKRLLQEAEDTALQEDLRKAFQSHGQSLSPRVAEVLESLVQILLWEAEAQVPKRIHEILERSGFHLPRQLFGFLVQVGRLRPDENLDLLKFKVPVGFPDGLAAEAERLASTPAQPDQRRDLRDLPTWAIDSETTRDRDDAFSIRPTETGYTLWIHIADVAAVVTPGSALDQEACRRGTTLYFPDGNVPMLPAIISEDRLSLNEGGDRPALTWEIVLSSDGEMRSESCYPSLIRVGRGIDYATADSLLEREADLAAGVRLAEGLKQRRRLAGALIVERQPEVKFSIDESGIHLGYRPSASPTSEMIAEFMVLANHLAARRCQEHGIPCLYRTQERSEQLPDLPAGFQPVAFYQALRYFKRTALGPIPGHHSSLGIGPYCQVTSPLRRFSDLLIQRQLKAHLAGQPLPYDAERFQQAVMMSDEAIRTAEMIMKNREEYFLLKFAQQELAAGRDTSTGTVADQGPSDLVVYLELLCTFRHCRKPGVDVAVGQKVTVRIKRADPFEGALRFEVNPLP